MLIYRWHRNFPHRYFCPIERGIVSNRRVRRSSQPNSWWPNWKLIRQRRRERQARCVWQWPRLRQAEEGLRGVGKEDALAQALPQGTRREGGRSAGLAVSGMKGFTGRSGRGVELVEVSSLLTAVGGPGRVHASDPTAVSFKRGHFIVRKLYLD